MILQDTRPLKCGKCSGTEIRTHISADGVIVTAICNHCGHSNVIKINEMPAPKELTEDRLPNSHREPHRKF